jgi:putative two-component system response regulator
VLFKTGPLSVDEWEIMKQHPTIGEQVVAPLRTLQVVRPIIRHHHERWDGSGYPDGLAGQTIPLTARVLQVVDAYDALRTRRPYKKALSHTQSADLLHMEASQGLWDKELLEEALTMFRSYRLPVGISW